MKSFKDFIKEKWETTVVSPYKFTGSDNMADVYKNPSKYELKKLLKDAKFHILRGILSPNGDVYVWDSYYLTHWDMRNEIPKLKEIKSKYFINVKHDDTYNSEYGSDNRDHPWVQKTLKDYRFFHSGEG